MIDRATVDRILDTAAIADVIGGFVSLRRRGGNFVACCPFHNEKTPSFSVSPSKGIFKCFGCGKSGNVVTFIMEHEHLSYTEALKFLARKYGIEVHEKEETAEEIAQRQRNESLWAVSEFAAQFFAETLFNDPMSRSVGLTYLRDNRGFSEQTIQKFGLGFAPSGNQLTEKALAAGYKAEYLTGAGLAIERNNNTLADRFYERVIFPIHSLSGRVIAFGGRTLRTDKSLAKYVNSPETEIYKKSHSLYGLFQAKNAISRLDKCYLVEGYTDVISFHQAGIENVVASSGTSLTSGQIRLIKRFTNKVTVLYDGDAAGIKASIRGIDMLLEEGMEIKVALFPDGDDPDSFAHKHTAEEIENFLHNSEQDFISFKYDLLSAEMAKDPMRRAEFIHEIIRTISLIPDQIARTVYAEECANRLGMKQDILTNGINKARKQYVESGLYQQKQAQQQAQEPVSQPTWDLVPHLPAEQPTRKAASARLQPTPIMEPIEKEILYYLIRFGENILHFEEEQKYNAEQPVQRITVAEYIAAELTNDGLELITPLFKKVYDLYYEIQKDGLTDQNRIQHRLINWNDPEITKLITNLITEEHTITIKEYNKALIPEENVLGTVVPKVILIFKAKFVDHTYQSVMKELAQAQSAGDEARQQELLTNIRILVQMRREFSNELNRL
ncbi:MAG: DNA primase [Bacteroidales bacterium]|nr:DNA primase [Bacteroidales bacterium]